MYGLSHLITLFGYFIHATVEKITMTLMSLQRNIFVSNIPSQWMSFLGMISLQSPWSACCKVLFVVKLASGKVSQADEDLGGYLCRYHTTNSSMRTGPEEIYQSATKKTCLSEGTTKPEIKSWQKKKILPIQELLKRTSHMMYLTRFYWKWTKAFWKMEWIKELEHRWR